MAIRRFQSSLGRTLSHTIGTSAFLAAILAIPATPLRAQAELTGDKAKVADAVRADLSRLVEAQKSYFGKNKGYSNDLGVLGFKPNSGAAVTISYASPRMWQANASHASLAPFVCFVIVNTAAANTPAEKPFCQDSKKSSAASALAAEGPATPTTTKAEPAPAPTKSEPPKPAPTKTEAPKPEAPKVETPKVEAPKPEPKVAVAPRKTAAPKGAAPAPKQIASAKPRAGRSTSPGGTATGLPAQGDVEAMARAATRPAGPVTAPGTPETVSLKQFTEQLAKIAEGAAQVLRAKPPELARDPYESSAEYVARRADAMAAYGRREAEYFAKNSRTFVVDLPAKDVRYDPDRETLELAMDAVQLPTLSAFSTSNGVPTLAVACYTRPMFWCSPDGGMSYESSEQWRVTRSKAREADVLKTPLTLQARFVVGPHEDVRGPALTLVALELQAKGTTLARWSSSAGR
jgi:hypothetical protein